MNKLEGEKTTNYMYSPVHFSLNLACVKQKSFFYYNSLCFVFLSISAMADEENRYNGPGAVGDYRTSGLVNLDSPADETNLNENEDCMSDNQSDLPHEKGGHSKGCWSKSKSKYRKHWKSKRRKRRWLPSTLEFSTDSESDTDDLEQDW